MRTCPQCGARYEAPAQFCQRDGVSLRDDEPEARDAYLGTRILGQFRIERVLGTGGMGIVYAAWDEALNRHVAVKILHKELVNNRDVVQRFHREAQIAHQLDHPHIVRLILFGQLPDGTLYLVLEYLEGPTLAAALETTNGPMPPERAVKILGAVCDAIGYAHRRDIVHRDLKPENVILVPREDDPEFPKVLDFGIAKMLAGAHDTQATQAGLIFGTAKYISPEGAQGERVDKRSDVYSLAVIGYQLLAGRPPFDAVEPVQLLLKHMQENPQPLRRLPGTGLVTPALEGVIMRALSKNPEARLPDASAFGRALREAIAPPGTVFDGPATNSSPIQTAVRTSMSTAAMGTFGVDGRPLSNPGDFVQPTPAVGTDIAAALAATHFVQSSPRIPVPGHEGASTGGPPSPREAYLAASAAYASSPPSQPAGPNSFAPDTQAQNSVVAQPGPGGATGQHSVAGVPVATDRAFTASAIPASRDEFALGASGPGRGASERSYGIDDDDDIVVPGLTRKSSAQGSGARTPLLVVLTVVFTLVAGAGIAWALGMYPSQRREAELRTLVNRATDALAQGKFTHATNGEDVEDLTDAILVLSPRHPRALELRASAITQLRNAAVTAHNEGRLRDALRSLYSARRLATEEGGEVEALLRTFEQERDGASAAPSAGPSASAAPSAAPTAAPRVIAAPRPAGAGGGGGGGGGGGNPTRVPTGPVVTPSALPPVPTATAEVPVFTPHPADPTAHPPVPTAEPPVVHQPPPVVVPQPEENPPQEGPYGFQ